MHNPSNRVVQTLIIIVLLATTPYALADRLFMHNGDAISGTIVEINEKEVVIKPQYSARIKVRFSAIESIETDQWLEIEMSDDSKFSARFAGARDGEQLLALDEEEIPLDLAALVKAAPPKSYYSRESSVDALLTINEGNTRNRSSILNADTRFRFGDHRQYAKLTLRRDENNGESTKKQNLARYEYDWLFRRAWYLGATAAYERDPIRELNHRFTFGTLLGHDFLDDAHSLLTIKAGLGYTDEKLGGRARSGAVALWELNFRQDLFEGNVELFHDHNISYQHYGDNNVIVKSNTGLRLDMLWDIYATASYRFDYETEPAPGKFKDDSTLAFGLGTRF